MVPTNGYVNAFIGHQPKCKTVGHLDLVSPWAAGDIISPIVILESNNGAVIGLALVEPNSRFVISLETEAVITTESNNRESPQSDLPLGVVRVSSHDLTTGIPHQAGDHPVVVGLANRPVLGVVSAGPKGNVQGADQHLVNVAAGPAGCGGIGPRVAGHLKVEPGTPVPLRRGHRLAVHGDLARVATAGLDPRAKQARSVGGSIGMDFHLDLARFGTIGLQPRVVSRI